MALNTEVQARLAAQVEDALAALEAQARPDNSAEILRRARCVIGLARAWQGVMRLEHEATQGQRVRTKAAQAAPARPNPPSSPPATAQKPPETQAGIQPPAQAAPLNRQARRRLKAEQARGSGVPKRLSV